MDALYFHSIAGIIVALLLITYSKIYWDVILVSLQESLIELQGLKKDFFIAFN